VVLGGAAGLAITYLVGNLFGVASDSRPIRE